MSPFHPFRGGGSPKGDNVTFFYRFFFISGLPSGGGKNLKRVSADAKGGFRMFEVAAIFSTQHLDHPSGKKIRRDKKLKYFVQIFRGNTKDIRLQTSLSSQPNPTNDHSTVKLPEQILFGK